MTNRRRGTNLQIAHLHLSLVIGHCQEKEGESVQLKVRVASGAALVNCRRTITQLLWSAATCRRYSPGVRTQAATSRRTPHRTRYLSVFCAHPDSHFLHPPSG